MTEQPAGSRPRSGLQRFLDLLRRIRRPSPRVRAALLVVAGVGVVVGMWFSARAIELDAQTVDWWLLAVVAALVTPLGVALNALELRVMGRAVTSPGTAVMTWPTALRAVVLATVANLLPLPAGALVRIQAVRAAGAGSAAATAINVAGAGMWSGAGLLIAGLALLLTDATLVAVAGVLIGMAAIAVGALMVRRLNPQHWRVAALRLAGVEFAFALLQGVRLMLVLLALGFEVAVWQGLVLGAAAPVAAAAGVFPAGIGLAEVLTALVSPFAALPEAAGFLVAGVSRLLGLGLLVPLAFWLGVREVVARPDATVSGEQPPPDQSS